MTIKIHQFSKDTLTEIVNIDTNMSASTGMTISHFASSVKSTKATLPFTIEGTEKHIPYIEDVSFAVVVRKRVDLTAIGPNEKEIKDVGKDVGKYDYADRVPRRPSDLPPGFEELYKQ